MNQNAIKVIRPYNIQGTWVFDDAEIGVRQEPFVGDVNDIIDYFTRDIPDAQNGFLCMFSHEPFPSGGKRLELTWNRKGEAGYGDYYVCEELGIEGWLCSVLLRYFPIAPKKIYVAFLPKTGRATKQQKDKENEQQVGSKEVQNGRFVFGN